VLPATPQVTDGNVSGGPSALPAVAAFAEGGFMTSSDLPSDAVPASVSLYWLPLGAGGRSVRWNGRVFEALAARRQHRAATDLYHSALVVHLGQQRYVIEMAPAWSDHGAERGVVQDGPVGARWLGRSILFRYEIRRWREGSIPDVAEAVESPVEVSAEVSTARRLLELVRSVPRLTWGRDELDAGEMWNSNSLTSWLLASTGHDMASIAPPAGGGAPGWRAGLVLAARSEAVA
jgi:hypothetical protein